MVTSSCQVFADMGNPLATADDWAREIRLASSELTNTRERESALDYVRSDPNPKPPRGFKDVKAFRIVETPRSIQRANLELTLKAIKALNPDLVQAPWAEVHGRDQPLKLRPAPIPPEGPEPDKYPTPKPIVTDEEIALRAAAYKAWRIKELTESLRLLQGESR